MNGILGDSVLDETLGEIEYVSLIDRVRSTENADDVCKEAAQVLGEIRDLLMQDNQQPFTAAALLGSELLDRLNVKYTHRLSTEHQTPSEYEHLDIVASMEGLPDGRAINRGSLLAANILEDAVPVLVGLRFLPAASDLLARITNRARVSRAPMPDLDYCLHCDGLHPAFSSRCWRTSPSVAIEAWVAPLARRAGWLVSDEKDLCPDCWRDADPEAAAKGNPPDPDFPIEFGDFDPQVTIEGGEPDPIPPPMSEEDQLREMAGMLCGFLSVAGSVDAVMEQVLEQFGVGQVMLLAPDLPTNARVFEVMKTVDPPLSPEDEAKLGELLDRIRALAPPAAPSPVQEEDILDRFFREAARYFEIDRSLPAQRYFAANTFTQEWLFRLPWQDIVDLGKRVPEARVRLGQYSGPLREYLHRAVTCVWSWQDVNPETAPVRGMAAEDDDLRDPYTNAQLIMFASELGSRFLPLGIDVLTRILRIQLTPPQAIRLHRNLGSAEHILEAVATQSIHDSILTPEGQALLGQTLAWLAEYGAST